LGKIDKKIFYLFYWLPAINNKLFILQWNKYNKKANYEPPQIGLDILETNRLICGFIRWIGYIRNKQTNMWFNTSALHHKNTYFVSEEFY
jgi:hypothetical protein